MSTRVTCPSCREVFSVPDDRLGRTVHCRYCRDAFRASPDRRPTDREDSRDRPSRRDRSIEREPGPQPFPWFVPVIVAAVFILVVLVVGGVWMAWIFARPLPADDAV